PMARDRQRAKQRQAERRAARLESKRADDEALEQAEFEAGAPPPDLGFSDATLEAEEEADAAEADLEADELDAADYVTEVEEEEEAEAEAAEPRARRRADADGTPAHGRRRHNKVVGFLIAVVAELRRVEWPD